MRPAIPALLMILALAASITARPAAAADTAPIPAYVAGAPRVAAWLAAHPGYRLVTDADCRCDDDIQALRAPGEDAGPPNPSYHPYYAAGDFDGDHRRDVAVAVALRRDDGRFRVLIVHQIDAARPGAPYLSEMMDHGEALFFGPPRPRPYRLVVGPFESEGAIFIPVGHGRYRLR